MRSSLLTSLLSLGTDHVHVLVSFGFPEDNKSAKRDTNKFLITGGGNSLKRCGLWSGGANNLLPFGCISEHLKSVENFECYLPHTTFGRMILSWLFQRFLFHNLRRLCQDVGAINLSRAQWCITATTFVDTATKSRDIIALVLVNENNETPSAFASHRCICSYRRCQHNVSRGVLVHITVISRWNPFRSCNSRIKSIWSIEFGQRRNPLRKIFQI